MKRNLFKIKTTNMLFFLIFILGVILTGCSSSGSDGLTDIISGCEKLQAEIKSVNASNMTRDAASYPGQYGQYVQNNQYSQYNQALVETVSGYQTQNAICPQPQHDPSDCFIENCYQCDAIRHGHSRHNSHCGH